MSKVIMIGCDLHQRSMVLQYCVGTGAPQLETFLNNEAGQRKMLTFIRKLAEKHAAERIVFAYEASSLGFGLCDLLHEQGVEAHVLSPTRMPKSAKQRKQKTDSKDALMILELVRGHVLAGNSLPVVWTPPQRLRDDRELVRARIETAESLTAVKLKILSMFKRRGATVPEWYRSQWSHRFLLWLRKQAKDMDPHVRPVLECLIDRYAALVKQEAKLHKALKVLAKTDRYKQPFAEVQQLYGVGLLTALTFLTEMGDLARFRNRREIAAYLGLCPSSSESGEASDRKGHITRQGPSRVRKLLCQAAWTAIHYCPETRAAYERMHANKTNRRKKAVVGIMRQLAIKMWHRALECGVSPELQGRGGPHALINQEAHAA